MGDPIGLDADIEPARGLNDSLHIVDWRENDGPTRLKVARASSLPGLRTSLFRILTLQAPAPPLLRSRLLARPPLPQFGAAAAIKPKQSFYLLASAGRRVPDGRGKEGGEGGEDGG